MPLSEGASLLFVGGSAELVAGFLHEGEVFGAAFADPRLVARGAGGERAQGAAVDGQGQPAHRINEAHTGDGHALAVCGGEHHLPHEVVHQCKGEDFFQYAVDCFTFQHIEADKWARFVSTLQRV